MKAASARFHLNGKIRVMITSQEDGTFKISFLDSTSKGFDPKPRDTGIASLKEAQSLADRLLREDFQHECNSTTCGRWIEEKELEKLNRPG